MTAYRINLDLGVAYMNDVTPLIEAIEQAALSVPSYVRGWNCISRNRIDQAKTTENYFRIIPRFALATLIRGGILME